MAQDHFTRIVGEPFKDYVNLELQNRQEIFGSGRDSNRTAVQQSYLNSRNAFIKVMSSVSIENTEKRNLFDNSGPERLRKLDLEAGFGGKNLAQNYVLFNTIGDGQKGGVARVNERIGNNAYGIGGTEFGIQPPPGIVSFDVNHINRGSIRKGSINIKAFNRHQFDVIESLYMRLGYTILIEWGHNKYITSEGQVKNVTTTLEDWWFANEGLEPLAVQLRIEQERKRYRGSFDAVFGRIVNFSWNYNTDGSYDIQVHFVSLGSVVESFKVNTPLRNTNIPKTQENNDEDDSVRESALGNIIYLMRSNVYEQLNSVSNTTNKKDLVEFGAVETERNDAGGATLFRDQFVRFGRLLYELEEHILSDFDGKIVIPQEPDNRKYKLSNGKFPIVYINYNDRQNWCNFKPLMISTNPRICYVNTAKITQGVIDTTNYPPNLRSETFLHTNEQDYSVGNIMNIYLNLGFLEEELKKGAPGKLTLFDFLNSICQGINSCFGDAVNLEVVFDEERNQVEIKDQNLKVQTNRQGSIFSDSSYPIQLHGFNKNGEGSFVKDYKVETKIGPGIVNQISIGAAAGGTGVTENATAFSRWNSGLRDRYQNVLDEAERNDVPVAQTGTTQSTLPIDSNLTAFQEWEAWLRFLFDVGWLGTESNNRSETYFTLDEDDIRKGASILQQYYIQLDIENEENSKKRAPGEVIGFIPIELQITLDGISGMTIYNQVQVNTEFLPSTYPRLMEFVVTGLGHTLRENGWETNITALPKATSKSLAQANGAAQLAR